MYCVMWKNIRIFPNKIFPQCSKRSDVNVSLSQVRLKNAETLSDNLKRKSQKLQSSLKQSERKSSQLGFKLATAEVKIKFLEDQVCLLEKDLKREHMGTSDNLNDAIEVISLFQLSSFIIHIVALMIERVLPSTVSGQSPIHTPSILHESLLLLFIFFLLLFIFSWNIIGSETTICNTCVVTNGGDFSTTCCNRLRVCL